MRSLLAVAVLIVSVVSSVASAKAPVSIENGGVFRRKIVTSDGVPLALYRYVPPGGGRELAPVLLIPDLGMGREVFDLDGSGLAPYLEAKGRDVFVLEPRGTGSSGVPVNWSIKDIIARDLPAAVKAIRADREGPIELVVHGYLGALVMVSTTDELQAQIGKIAALATPTDAEVPNALAEALLRSGGRLSGLNVDQESAAIFETLFAKHGRFAPGHLAALRSRAFSDLGPVASGELLRWMRNGDFTFADGTTFRARLAKYDRPTLQLIPLRDNWVHPEHASRLRELAPNAKVSVRLLSMLDYIAEDYTHLSVLQGAGASRDIYPLLSDFFDRPGVPPSNTVASGEVR